MRLGCDCAGAAWAGSRVSAYRATSRLLVFIVVLLSSMLMVVPAYALSDHPGVEINGWNLEKFGMDGKNGFLVYAPDRFSAAALSLGYSWDEVQSFTDQQRSYMTNASTGGDFYTYAQRFEELSASTPSLGEDADYAWAMGYLQSNQVIWGGRVYNDAWAINTTSEWRSDAKQKIGDILDGNLDNGGGGSQQPSEPVEGFYYYSCEFTGATTNTFVDGCVGICLNKSKHDSIMSYLNAHTDVSWFWSVGNGNASPNSVATGTNGTNFYTNVLPTFGFISGVSSYPFGVKTPTNYAGSSAYNRLSTSNLIRTYNGQKYLDISDNGTPTVYVSSNTGGVNVSYSNVTYMYYYGRLDYGPSTGEPDPPNNWPEPPDNPVPQPPDVPSPEPPDEPIEPDPPIQPITPYPDPPVVVEPTPPQTVDLSDLLEALDNHCLHLRNALHSEFANFDTDFRNQMAWLAIVIDDAIYGLDVDIGSYFAHLEGYLEDLANWLADQFEFSVDGYDDSSLITWLKSIFAKMGTGSTNTRPVDPATDPIGIGDWLEQLFSNFTGDLNDIGSSELESTVTEYRALSTKFPLCVPWDLYNMLSLLVAEPVTPVIDFPWFALTSNGLVSNNVRINLAAWDTTMVPVRLMEKLTYCMFLASRSKDLLSLFRLGRGD